MNSRPQQIMSNPTLRTYLFLVMSSGPSCCCDCCSGRACKRSGDENERSPRWGRRIPASGHRETRWGESDYRAASVRQCASHGRGKCERVPRNYAADDAPGVRAQTLERLILRDLTHSNCQA